MEDKSKKNKYGVIFLLLFAIIAGIICAGYFWFGMTKIALIRLACFEILGQIIVVFTLQTGDYYDNWLISNRNHKKNFLICYAISLLFSAFLSLIPVEAWPFIVVFVLLTITSNVPCGIISGCMCLVVASCLGDTVYFAYFLVYFLCGIMAALLLAHVDEQFQIGMPVFISEFLLLTSLLVITVTSGSKLTMEQIIYPVINGAVSLLILMITLKIYASRVIFAKEDIYIEINDPECQLLTELKNISPEDYYKTVHVVYFCDRLSKALGLCENEVKCAALYHRIGVIGGANNYENIEKICSEQGIPEVVLNVLKEYTQSGVPISCAETAVLYMAECVVSSIQYLYQKNNDYELNIPSIIEAIFKQRTESGIFKECNISIKQFEAMKKVFVEEKLYYDFLR